VRRDLEAGLEGFRAAPLAPVEEVRRAGQILRFLALVPIEYDRGVEDGRDARLRGSGRRAGSRWTRYEVGVQDLAFIALVVGFFALAILLARRRLPATRARGRDRSAQGGSLFELELPAEPDSISSGFVREVERRRTAITDGALMEPWGRNQWQSLAKRQAAKAAKTSEIRCRGLPPVAATPKW